MAKVDGPLMSFGASGSVANMVVFSKWKGRPYVRQHVTPSNPRSALQVSTRAMMKFLAQNWAALSAAEKATWDDAAAAGTFSGFNAYTQYNMRRWTQSQGPSIEYPAAELIIPTDPTPFAATGGVGQAVLDWTMPAADAWGVILYRSLTTGFTPSRSNAIAAIFCDTADSFAYTDTPLDPETYFWRIACFSVDGLLSAPTVTQVTAVVT